MINTEFKPMVLTIKLYCLNSPYSPILIHTEVHWHFGANMRNSFAFPLQMIHFYLLSTFSFLSPLFSGSVSQHSTKFATIKTSNILFVARPQYFSCRSLSLGNLLSTYYHLHTYASQILSVPWVPKPNNQLSASQTTLSGFSQKPQTHWFQPWTFLMHFLFWWVTPFLIHSYHKCRNNPWLLPHLSYLVRYRVLSISINSPPPFLPLLWFRPSPSFNLMTTNTAVTSNSQAGLPAHSFVQPSIYSQSAAVDFQFNKNSVSITMYSQGPQQVLELSGKISRHPYSTNKLVV